MADLGLRQDGPLHGQISILNNVTGYIMIIYGNEHCL